MEISLKNRSKISLAVLAIASIAGASSSAKAAILYSTNFNSPTYSDGALIGQDGWLITGTSVVSPITVANTATNGNVTLTTTGQDVNRPFTSTANSGSVYLSADISVSAAATGDYFLHLSDGTASNFNDRVYAKATTNGFLMAVGSSSGTATYGATVLSLNTTYHVVAEYDFVAGATNDTASLYVNPTDPLFGEAASLYVGPTTTGGVDATTISAVNLRQGSATAAPGVTVDNITVAVPDATPEPASLGLLGLGAVSLLTRRRK